MKAAWWLVALMGVCTGVICFGVYLSEWAGAGVLPAAARYNAPCARKGW